MKRHDFEKLEISNLNFPALYIPIDIEEGASADGEFGTQALAELRQRGLKYRIVPGGLAILVQSADKFSLVEFWQWLSENEWAAEIIE